MQFAVILRSSVWAPVLVAIHIDVIIRDCRTEDLVHELVHGHPAYASASALDDGLPRFIGRGVIHRLDGNEINANCTCSTQKSHGHRFTRLGQRIISCRRQRSDNRDAPKCAWICGDADSQSRKCALDFGPRQPFDRRHLVVGEWPAQSSCRTSRKGQRVALVPEARRWRSRAREHRGQGNQGDGDGARAQSHSRSCAEFSAEQTDPSKSRELASQHRSAEVAHRRDPGATCRDTGWV